MPRYFFHTADGSRERDMVGTELPNRDSARKEAIIFAGSTISENPGALWDGRDFRVEVTDGETLLFTVIVLAVEAAAAGRS